jgi:hypothetical protein
LIDRTRIIQTTLPHFNKVLAGKLLHKTEHLQFKKCGDQL